MKVRAMFVVGSKVKQDEGHEITMHVVAGEGYEDYFEATPTGEITMGVLNEAAADAFEVGKAYYVDFTPEEG